jgi:hypothetical protein
MKWWLLLISLLVCVYLGFKFGYVSGRATSPHYDPEIASAQFIMRNATITQLTDGSLTETVDAGWKHYEYRVQDDSLKLTPLSAKVLDYRPKRNWEIADLDKLDALTGAATVTEGGIIARFMTPAAALVEGPKDPRYWAALALRP